MNLKKTAIALAVASVAATPLVAAADGTIWGSMRYGFVNTDAGGTNEAVNQFKNFGSRFGVKGETDLGNGMSAFGAWEIHMFGAGLRDFKVGVKGDFGQVYMGDGINHAYDTFMTPDSTWWYGGAHKISDGIQSNAITYMGDFGAVRMGASVQMDPDTPNSDEEATDAIEVAVGFDAGPVAVNVGFHDVTEPGNADPDPTIAVNVKGSAGSVSYAVEFQSQSEGGVGTDDATHILAEVGVGNFVAQYSQRDNGGPANTPVPNNVVLSYYHKLGERTLMWFEFNQNDPDTVGGDATTNIAAVLRYDIL